MVSKITSGIEPTSLSALLPMTDGVEDILEDQVSCFVSSIAKRHLRWEEISLFGIERRESLPVDPANTISWLS
jgi:hypothetical protein